MSEPGSLAPDFLFKLVIVGDAGVGKSSLLIRFTDGNFSKHYISTIGVDFRFKTLKINGKFVKLQIWDTAGQERFKTITKAYYRGADGVILVYDVTSPESFDHVASWLEQVEKYANEDTVKLIVGNKADLVDEKKVDSDRARAFGAKFSIDVVETSAKTADNVDSAFTSLGTALISSRGSNSREKKEPGKVNLRSLQTGKRKKCCK